MRRRGGLGGMGRHRSDGARGWSDRGVFLSAPLFQKCCPGSLGLSASECS